MLPDSQAPVPTQYPLLKRLQHQRIIPWNVVENGRRV